MTLRPILSIFLLLATTTALFPSACQAERAPRDVAELADTAELVVVGKISDLQVRSEPAHIEQGWGNTDWAIDLKVTVNSVEKGELPPNTSEITARCFRIRTRTTAVGFLTPSGVQPIPGRGEEVRLYLYQSGDHWRVEYPNGIQSAKASSATGASRVASFTDAAEVSSLPAPTFTLLLSLEAFALIGLVVALIVAWQLIKTWRASHRREPSDASAGTA